MSSISPQVRRVLLHAGYFEHLAYTVADLTHEWPHRHIDCGVLSDSRNTRIQVRDHFFVDSVSHVLVENDQPVFVSLTIGDTISAVLEVAIPERLIQILTSGECGLNNFSHEVVLSADAHAGKHMVYKLVVESGEQIAAVQRSLIVIKENDRLPAKTLGVTIDLGIVVCQSTAGNDDTANTVPLSFKDSILQSLREALIVSYVFFGLTFCIIDDFAFELAV